MSGVTATAPQPTPPSLHPPTASGPKHLSHSAPASPLYAPHSSFAEAQASYSRSGKVGGGGPNARRSWLDATIRSRESSARPPLRTVGDDDNDIGDARRVEASTRTSSSHSSDSSASDRSRRADAQSISSASSSSTAIATPRTSSLGSDEFDLKAPSPLSLPPLLPHKLERKKSSFGGVIKSWFGGGASGSAGSAKGKKKDSAAQSVDQRGSARLQDPSTCDSPDASPPTTPVEAHTQRASTLGLSLPVSSSGLAPAATAPASPFSPIETQPTAAPPAMLRSRASSASALPPMVRTPPSLTPLQSLHLLSAQKLSIMFRPSPHPLFLSRAALTGLTQRSLSAPGALPTGPGGPGRRFPASTNPLTRRNQQRYLGLAAEAGIRAVMRKLEEGMVASSEEIEALIRLFAVRPIALIRDKSGRFVATISDPSDLDASLVDAFAPTLPSAKAANAGQLGSGILAFVRRPPFEQRYTEILSHPQVPDRTFSFDVVRARRRKAAIGQCGAGSSLRFSVAMTSLAAEVESGQVFRTLASKSPSATTTLLPTLSSGRTSPTDMVKERTEPLIVDAPPALPVSTLSPSSATTVRRAPPLDAEATTPIRAPALSLPSIKLEPSSPPPAARSAAIAQSQPIRLALAMPGGLKRDKTVTRRSASFSGLDAHIEDLTIPSTSALDDDDAEDAVPLSAVARRQSFAALTSARAASTTPAHEVPSSVSLARASRGVRFSVDTEALVRATDERLAADLKTEKERQRLEELDRKREERFRAEIAATRERRENAKVGGQRKGNGGRFEDWDSLGRRAGAPTTLPSKASMRDFSMPPAPVPSHGSGANVGPPLSGHPSQQQQQQQVNQAPRSRFSRQFLSGEPLPYANDRSSSSERSPLGSSIRAAPLPDLQPPSLIHDSGESSPQTSLSSNGPPLSTSAKRRSTMAPVAPTKDVPSSASIRSRPAHQLKSHASVATFAPSISTTATTVRPESRPSRPMSHSRSSPAIPTVGHLGGFYPPPMPVPFPPVPQLIPYGPGAYGHQSHPMDFGLPPSAYHQPYGSAYGHVTPSYSQLNLYSPQQQQQQLYHHQRVHPVSHAHPQPAQHHPAALTRTRQPSNTRQ